ncbi:MAG: hypothetical protein WC935_05555, partial [Thermoleophilia bacterium]
DAWFDMTVAGIESDLEGFNSGLVTAGQSVTPRYTGLIGGPVEVGCQAENKVLVSQRTLWPAGGNSLEEVIGTDTDKLSDLISTNGGATWSSSNGGLIDTNVNSLDFSPNYSNDQTLFAGGYGGGVYVSPPPNIIPVEKPSLGIGTTTTYWASYADYLQSMLSVTYSINNSAGYNAYNVQITGSSANNGVILKSGLPALIGDITIGSSRPVTFKYLVQNSVSSFRTTNNATCNDANGNLYTYGS